MDSHGAMDIINGHRGIYNRRDKYRVQAVVTCNSGDSAVHCVASKVRLLRALPCPASSNPFSICGGTR